MNSFKILNKDGVALPINTIDKEICEILGHDLKSKHYAKFKTPEECKDAWEYAKEPNWFDTFGWMIASEGKSWLDMIAYYVEPMKEYIGQKNEDDTLITIDYIYPKRMNVLRAFIEKGYQPIQIIS